MADTSSKREVLPGFVAGSDVVGLVTAGLLLFVLKVDGNLQKTSNYMRNKEGHSTVHNLLKQVISFGAEVQNKMAIILRGRF